MDPAVIGVSQAEHSKDAYVMRLNHQHSGDMMPAKPVPLEVDTEIDLVTKALQKVSCRVLPLLFLVGVFNYLDRGNLSFAALELLADLGLSSEQYGLGSGLFYLSYGVFMIPSTFMTMRYGARWWYGFITIAWGVVSTCTALIRSHTSFYLMRFLLGAAEAGSATSAWHLLCQFYPTDRLTIPYAVLTIASVVSAVFAAPLAAGLMSLRGPGGLAGWQYLFILEGAPTVLLGLAAWIWLPNGPLEAWMLDIQEREALHVQVHGNSESAEVARQPPSWKQLMCMVWDAARRPVLWYMIAIGFLWVLAVWSLNAWMPIIVKNMLSGTALSGSSSSSGSAHINTQATLLTAIPYICAACATYAVAWHADRVKERTLHIALPYVAGGIILCCFRLFYEASFAAGFAVLVIAMMCASGGQATMITKVAAGLPIRSAGIGLSIFNAVAAAVGGFSGPLIVGALVERLGTFYQATLVMGALLLAAGCLALGLGMYERCQSRDRFTRQQQLSFTAAVSISGASVC